MIRYLRQQAVSKSLAMALALSMSGLIGNLYANAAENADGQNADERHAQTEVLKAKGLVTIEQVYAGMLEAEATRAAVARVDPGVDNAMMAEKWGVQVISVSYAADGFWLAFRFRVLDPDKANILFDTKLKPYLESESSGVKLAVPTAAKIGALRTTNRGHNVKAGKIYNIMFSNPGFHVQPGQKVSVVSGDFRAEHLTVRGAREYLSVNEKKLQQRR
jgi:hypothetical protein